MGYIKSYLDQKLYPKFQDRWDDKLFREWILGRVDINTRLLDVGAGRGAKEEYRFRGLVNHVAGVDVDPAVLDNPHLDDARLIRPPDFLLPFDDASFDVAFAASVLEHVEDVKSFLSEVRRVLRPNGVFLAKTPNRWHYVALIATLTPHRFHEWYNRLRGRDAIDTFPTFYRCNTRRAVNRMVRGSGLKVVRSHVFEGRPEYLRITAPTYVAGALYERIVNCSWIFQDFGAVMLIETVATDQAKY